MAVCATTLALIAAGAWLMPGQHAPVGTVAGGAIFAVLAMLGARYVAFAVRQRSRPRQDGSQDHNLRAGSAGGQLLHRLAGQRGSEYRPVPCWTTTPRSGGCGSTASPCLAIAPG